MQIAYLLIQFQCVESIVNYKTYQRKEKEMNKPELTLNQLSIFCFMLLCLHIPSILNADCWDVFEVSQIEFAELDESIIFSFKDAVTCSAIQGVQVEFLGKHYKTDTEGYITFPLSIIHSKRDNAYPLKAQKKGYCSFSKDIHISVGTILEKRFLMTKELPIDNVRFILQWGNAPKDLDLHLIGKDFHISYRHMKHCIQKAKLDRDDVDWYGPETITLDKIIANESYSVYVHNYSGESPIPENVQVSVYKNNQLDRILSLPATRQRAIKVLEIINNRINYQNSPIASIPN